MAYTYLFASIPVAELDAALAWYERLLGRPPDLVPHAREAAWRITDTGWIYVLIDAERAGSALHTLLVDDLDAFLAGIAQRGISAGPLEMIGDGVRRVGLADPEGNRLYVGEPPA
ncbi:MAG TPA: VOC family protein [Solirubrobacteraceae bacterium]|jgi:predicted enzyme related to lactoylglutathione lyase